MNRLFTEKKLVMLSMLIIFLVYVPYLILRQNAHFCIYDNLDSPLVWAKMVVDAGAPFLSPIAIIEQMMNGISLSGVYGSYDFSLIIFKIFGMFWGYVVNKYLMVLIAFFGMFFLLKKYVLTSNTPAYITVGSALVFSLIPFWSFTASVAGIPFAIYAFFNLRQNDKSIWNWIILFIYGFYSSLILTGVFLLMFILFILIRDLIKNKRINWYLFSGMAMLSIVYIISHLPLFASFLFDAIFVDVRKEFRFGGYTPLRELPSFIYSFLVYGDKYVEADHMTSVQQFIIIPSILLSFYLQIKNKCINKLFVALIIFIICSSALVGVLSLRAIAPYLQDLMQFVPINLKRIYWFHPIAWYILFAISLYTIYKYLNKGKFIVYGALSLQLILVVFFQEYCVYAKSATSYKEFYAEKQFGDIKQFINKDVRTYRVISMGLHPTISLYNGFYTVDGFSVNYSLDYKYKFRRIIAPELEKNLEAEQVYDRWGGWCYAYWGNLGINDLRICQNKYPKIEHLDFNYDVLKEMGGEYIISATEINTDNNKRLEFLKKFDNYPDSHWTIYLYKVL